MCRRKPCTFELNLRIKFLNELRERGVYIKKNFLKRKKKKERKIDTNPYTPAKHCQRRKGSPLLGSQLQRQQGLPGRLGTGATGATPPGLYNSTGKSQIALAIQHKL